ncbi:MAG: hypothetical protein HY078_12075 [Elusimicrobia bacterium]|nr:hypothetical protein [Elusimicrobiota bacterium]
MEATIAIAGATDFDDDRGMSRSSLFNHTFDRFGLFQRARRRSTQGLKNGNACRSNRLDVQASRKVVGRDRQS